MKVNNQTLSNEWPTYCHTGIYIGTTSVKLAENAYLKIIFLLFALHRSVVNKSRDFVIGQPNLKSKPD
jgi:hypothetical protein